MQRRSYMETSIIWSCTQDYKQKKPSLLLTVPVFAQVLLRTALFKEDSEQVLQVTL